MPEIRNNWWRPIWCGLVADPEGRHIRTLGAAGWMLFYVILHADPRTGILTCRRSVIACRMGMPLRTVQRWLTQLEQSGYVSITGRNGVATISVRRWKSLRAGAKVDVLRARVDA
jgi:hypothetical protein